MPTLFPLAFHAKTLAVPMSKLQAYLAKEVDLYLQPSTCFAVLDLDTLSWKTPHISLIEECNIFSSGLPKAGTMQNGKLYARRGLDIPTFERECLLLPTPTRKDSTLHYSDANKLRAYLARGHQNRLLYTLLLLSMNDKQIVETYEEAQGFPITWTELR